LSVTNKSKPTTVANAPTGRLAIKDTLTTTIALTSLAPAVALYNSDTSVVVAGNGTGYTAVNYYFFMDSATGSTRAAGTYVYTILAQPFSAAGLGTPKTVDVTITIAALASESLVASAANSTA
jgi:hypothetical protein